MSYDPKSVERCRRDRHDAIDTTVVTNGLAKTARIDLGLQLLQLAAKPGTSFTLHEIALWCGCTRDAVLLIEQKALKKVRTRIRFGRDSKLFRELAA
ncbi:hypothetical protein [Opitutus terrae]|uniref:Uncharacterized protein n=1 Tax=Opitutus terrae (strain DSM 11246 / JCM 15787 / PB90-1) TaxID=452637 RepID=B1ZUA0_OPITP|nr:hypothetical protein [Opitutus terrae]ACB76662.1 hypothetical protein Oter_3385 [Opitutus terrae PB90-1]